MECYDIPSPFYFISWNWTGLWMFWHTLWLCFWPSLSFFIPSTFLLIGVPPGLIFKNLCAKGLKNHILSRFSVMYLENWGVIYLGEDVVNCLVGKIYWGLVYLIPHCIVECGLFLTSLLFKQCQRILSACQTHSQNGCQAVRWLPRSEHSEQVQNGDQVHRICWSDSPAATLNHPLPNTQPPPKKEGEKSPEDARLGTNPLARVVVVSSRDSSSHRVLLASQAWQKTVQGNTWGENTTVKQRGRFLYLI